MAVAITRTDSVKVDGNKAEITKAVYERVQTLADLVRVCEIDTEEWEIERWTCMGQQQGSVPRATGKSKHWERKSAEVVVTQLFHVKAWLRRRVALLAVKAELAELAAEARASATVRDVASAPTGSGKALEVAIPDLHVGKLAWALETGWENYDSKIAEQVFEHALHTLLERVKGHQFEQIIFPVGNDLLHADTKQGTTNAGTQLDTDVRFQKNFGIVRRMITRAIDTLRVLAPVKVVMVPGNHDMLSVWHLGDSLECYYNNTADVEIDNAPSLRKYVQFGSVMLMFTHGNAGKLEKYPQVMAAEKPKMWGETRHHEAHTGDKHQLKVQEHFGVKVRISPALCPPDAWHSEHQFVGQGRSAEAFVWDREEGLIGTAYYTVPAPGRAK